MTQIVPLTAGVRDALPPPCAGCVFWQHPRLVSDQGRRAAWDDLVERRHGAHGRILSDDTGFRGMVQYGPAHLFPRAWLLPAGPPDRTAALVTCTFLADGDDVAGVLERLLLEALADLKRRGVPAVEAFALRHGDKVPARERHLGHHTLLDRDVLERLGFSPVRAHGRVSLMRLSLGGLLAAPGCARRVREALAARLAPPRPAAA